MNTWATRLQVCAAMMLAILAHACATDSVPNTPEGMFVYHMSGAGMDLLLGLLFTAVLAGWHRVVMQWLIVAAIFGNLAGFCLYMAFVSPVFYNVAMWSITLAQCLCLFLPESAPSAVTLQGAKMTRNFFKGVRNARAS